jgi:long-chain fatty acid transport protein
MGVVAVGTTALAFFGEAWGSGFQIRENSASALGNAFAGAAASSEDPSIIANNPAGMIGLSGNQVSGDIAIIIPSTVFSGMGLTAARQPISGGNRGDAGGAQPVPAAYGLYDVSPDLKIGLALTAPFGLQTQYERDWVGRYQAIRSDIATININPNVAIGSRTGYPSAAGRQYNTPAPSLPTPSIRRRLYTLPIRLCRLD